MSVSIPGTMASRQHTHRKRRALLQAVSICMFRASKRHASHGRVRQQTRSCAPENIVPSLIAPAIQVEEVRKPPIRRDERIVRAEEELPVQTSGGLIEECGWDVFG